MKTYNFLFSGTPEQFEAAVERYRADAFERGDGSYLFDKENGNYLFGVCRGGHMGGYWYCPSYSYADGKLLISGKIRYLDDRSRQKGVKKALNTISDILSVIFLSPLILIVLTVRGAAYIARKICPKQKPQSEEEKALLSLMIERLNCERA